MFVAFNVIKEFPSSIISHRAMIVKICVGNIIPINDTS